MFDVKKRLPYLLIFAMILGTVIVGMVVGDNADAKIGTPTNKTHEVTRIVRTADDYFEGMNDQQITEHARVVCAVLRSGETIETAVNVEARTIPAAHVGVLVDSAISVYCRDYRPAMQEFIDREH